MVEVTWTTPELAPPLLTTTPHQREDVSALDRFSAHRCPSHGVFSGTGFEPVTKQPRSDTYTHSATAATSDATWAEPNTKLGETRAGYSISRSPCSGWFYFRIDPILSTPTFCDDRSRPIITQQAGHFS
ncbi:uncharacterized protein TNCV_2449331 [Trichonephila clavipes]|nr:uncharacterized protein TNCV_2449331 [Trichonephila clavipes]